MEPLFSAVICGCNAGLFREALHEAGKDEGIDDQKHGRGQDCTF
jgi:hypothetical protein